MELDVNKLSADLGRLIGKEYVFVDKPTNLLYAKDVMPWDVEEQYMPYAVARPAGAGDVSAVLRYANEQSIPVHIHGAGTSLIGLARPKTRAIVLDMGRMTEITVYPERGYFETGAGAHIHLLRKELAKHGAMLPIFPGSEWIATIGGIVAVNTSAHAVDAALGKPGDYVLGLEAVLPTGEILDTGTESTRRPAGIEHTKLLVGSEGLLCVITKLRMRLVPLPYFENIVAYYDDVDDILDAVMAMYRQNVPPPMFFEFLDGRSAGIGFKAVGLADPGGPVGMMTLHCWSKAGCRDLADNFVAFLKSGRPREARVVDDKQEWEKIWGSRAEAGNYVYRLGSTFGSEVSPRIDKLKEAYHEAKAAILGLESYKDVMFHAFGHIGAPSIHAYAFVEEKDLPNDVKKAIMAEVRQKTEDINVKYGGCGGEWGVTGQSVPFLRKRYNGAYFNLLLQLKRTLDPKNILNRGNIEVAT